MKNNNNKFNLLLAGITLLASSLTLAQNNPSSEPTSNQPASPSTGTQLYWGDTHLHTSYSFDAYLSQNDSADPDTAYRWAKGLPVIHPYNNVKVQLARPLDFLVVSDHAEAMGVLRSVNEELHELSDMGMWDSVKRWFAIETIQLSFKWGFSSEVFVDMLPDKLYSPGGDPVKDKGNTPLNDTLGNIDNIVQHSWHAIIDAAEKHNQPGKFTALLGWEWSSIPAGANLHRVVLSPNGKAEAKQYIPFSSIDSQYPQDLWAWLDKTSAASGSQFIAIPHNSNISKGYMFPDKTLAGKAIDQAYINTRKRWEPIIEITQIKGDSETHPDLSPDDNFADFEHFDRYLQRGEEKYKARIGDFARSALKRGLEMEAKLGSNPYQFGFIGSTDSHSGLSTAEEKNFWGKMAYDSTPANKAHGPFTEDGPSGWDMSVAGLAAVWAKENTRQGIFDAFKRREVYATTGPRIQLRTFAGWEFQALDHQNPDFAATGYRKGVPMGGELSQAPDNGNLKLMIHAVKDPLNVGLDRLQIIKGWLDDKGRSQEKIFNVAWAGKRQLDGQGKLAAIENSVDLNSGLVTKDHGAKEFSLVWQDPEFDPSQSAFYYVRVLQIPTARHSLMDAIALQAEPYAKYSSTIQERAYSSPIWYKP